MNKIAVWVCNFIVFLAVIFSGLVSAKPYKGGEVFTLDDYKYGKYVIRMRAAKGSGIISNFFTYKNGSEQPSTFWEEIDIEVFGKNNARSWQSNLITGYGPTRTEGEHHESFSFADDYHTFTLEWVPSKVTWFVDGRKIREVNGGQADDLTNKQDIRFNLWAPAIPDWVGAWNDSVLPVYQFINYIEYHSYDSSNGRFNLQWRDDFNSFNGSRWVKASHTFSENRVDFSPSNVIVRDGKLILALTHEGQTGFQGSVPADAEDSGGSTPNCQRFNLPRKIEAEDYCAMQGIQLENTGDIGGGRNVGYVDTGDWLSYDINVPASGQYEVSYRVASQSGGGVIALEQAGGGTNYGYINIPKTNAWQSYQTVKHTVQLSAGQQSMGIRAASGGWNLNWFEISSVSNGGGSNMAPITIQAEDYTQMQGVKTESTSDVGGGKNVGWIDSNDWMSYAPVTIPETGDYVIEYRIASNSSGGQFWFQEAGGSHSYASLQFASTGGWQNWKTVKHTVRLTAGEHRFGINASTGGWNINWFRISKP